MQKQSLPEKKISIEELLKLPIKVTHGEKSPNQFVPWSIDAQQNLILSIFYNKEIGKLILTEDLTLLDGRQIYTAIKNFVSGKFSINELTFKEMKKEQQIIFNEYMVTYYETEDNVESSIDIFKKINTK